MRDGAIQHYVSLYSEAIAVYKRFTGLMLSFANNQHAPTVNWNVYFQPSEGTGESGVVTVNTSSQPDRGIPYGIVHCGICKK